MVTNSRGIEVGKLTQTLNLIDFQSNLTKAYNILCPKNFSYISPFSDER